MNKILAVVVTYNRCNSLKECIKALKCQTHDCFDILVINNGSTDDTKEYLDSESSLYVIHQKNVGGAGGFYTGMKYMYDHNYEWLWLMDDDGIPAPTQLEELIKFKDESWYLNALVIDKDDHSQFAFKPHDSSFTPTVARQQTSLKGFVHPFNGTMYKRELIEKIGLIKREMFIWGDEKEYTFRALKAGIVPTTITTAVHYHPTEKAIKKYPLPFWKSPNLEVLIKPTKLSHHYYRNLGYIDLTYRSRLKSLKLVLVHLFYFITRLKFSECGKFLKYYHKGRNNCYE